MKNNFMMVALSIVAISCNRHTVPSVTPYSNAEIQNEQGKTILAGHCSLSMLYKDPYHQWFDTAYTKYTVDSSIIPKIAPLLQNKEIEIFLGSWCGDSKRETPRMIKILQAASFDTAHLRLIFVDNSTKTYKQSPQHEEKQKNIHHVPTIIVYENDKEIGRIIESPVASLEKDLLSILQRQQYTPNYIAIAYWQKNIRHPTHLLSEETLRSFIPALQPLCESVREFNAYGYVLLAQHNFNEALNVFRLNTFLYPENAVTFGSLAEACYTVGNKEEAKKNYQKVLLLKPDDEKAKKMLSVLN